MADARNGSANLRMWGGLAGILFVALMLTAPDPYVREGASLDQIKQFYVDNQEALGLMLILIGSGFILFLYFSIVLQGEARRVEARSDSMATMVLISAALIAGFFVLGTVLRTIPATAVAAGASAGVLESAFHITNTVNDRLVEIATFWRGSMLGAAAILILRTRVVPTWIGWMAALLSVTSLAGALSFVESAAEPVLGSMGFASFLLFHLWVLITSVALAFGRRVRAQREGQVSVRSDERTPLDAGL